MSVLDRLLRPSDLPSALDLWQDAFGMERAQLAREFTTRDPRRFAHTRAAVVGDGTVVATISYSVRRVRDPLGRPQRVGAVANVATLPAARRQGHARRLLAATEEAMRAEGCRWALLFTTEAGRPLYEAAGWQALPRYYHEGRLSPGLAYGVEEASAPPAALDGYTVAPYDSRAAPSGWAPLARVHAAYNALRPLSVMRPAWYWRRYVALRVATALPGHPLQIVMARRDPSGDVCGYAIARLAAEPGAVLEDAPRPRCAVVEIGVVPGDEAALAVLLAAVAGRAGTEALCRFFLPEEPALDAALCWLCGGPPRRYEDRHMMVKALAGDPAQWPPVGADPPACYWLIDEV